MRRIRQRIPVVRLSAPLRRLFGGTRRVVAIVGVLLLIAVLPVVLWQLAQPNKSQAAWYNEAYQYRIKLSITNPSGSTLSNYQVQFTLNTASHISVGRMQSDCDDVRFVDKDGIELPYWIETGGTAACNASGTTFWVKVPSIPTTGTDIYIYYGNPAAGSAQDPYRTFDFFDDFSQSILDGTRWTATGATSIANGELTITTGSVYTKNMASLNNGRIYEMRAKWASTATGYAGLTLANAQNIQPINGNSNALSMLISNAAADISLRAYGANGTAASYNVVSNVSQFTPVANTYYVIGMSQDASNLRFYQNRSMTNSYSGSVGFNPYVIMGHYSGNIASTTDITDITIDYVLGRKFTTNEPTVTSAFQETGPGSVAYWAFDEGSGQIVFNSGGGGYGDLTTVFGQSDLETASGWTTSNATPTVGSTTPFEGSNYLRVTSTSAGSSYVAKSPLTVGKTYRIKGFARGNGTNAPSVVAFDNTWTGTTSTTWQPFDFVTTAVSQASVRFGSSSTSGNAADYDAVTITEIPPNAGLLGSGGGSDSSDPLWLTDDQCVSGKCLSFDGSSDYVRISAAGGLNVSQSSAFTIEGWVKADGTSSQRTIFNKQQNTTDEFFFTVERTAADKFAFIVGRHNVGSTTLTGTTTVQANTWYYVTAVSNGSTLYLYVNGKLEGSTAISITGSAQSTASLFIGQTYNNSNYWDGTIDEVRAYIYARSADQIKTDYVARGSLDGASATAGTPEQKGLNEQVTLYWKLNESSLSGNCFTPVVTDSSSFGNNGSACPSGSRPTGGVNGKFGKAVSFDGTDDSLFVIDPTNGSLDIQAGSFSAFAWIKTSSATNQVVLSKGGFSSAGYRLIVTSGGLLSLTIQDSGSIIVNSLTSTTGNLTNGGWHHVGFTWNPKQGAGIYIDGQLAGQQIVSTTTNIDSTSDFRVGDDAVSLGAIFNGLMDEVRVYQRHFSTSEVQALYNWSAGPVGYWNLDENTGYTFNDRSGNNSLGTLFNGAAWTTGKHGNAVNFDGSNDYATVTNESLYDFERTDAFSFSAWVAPNITRSGGSTAYRVINKRTTTGTTPGWELNMVWDGSKTIYRVNLVNTSAGGNFIQVSSNSDIPNTTWNHVTVTYDGSSSASGVQIYVDGKAETMTTNVDTLSASMLNNTNITIGGYDAGAGTGYFSGKIDEVKIYNYQRTLPQIIEDLNAGQSMANQTPVGTAIAHYKFDEQSGQTVNNSGYGGSAMSGNRGASSGSSTDDPSWLSQESCKTNGCLSFDGGDYATVADQNALDITGAISVSAWVYPTNLSAYHRIIAKMGSGEATGYMLDSTSGAGRLRFRINSNDCETTTTVLTTNTWYHVAATYDLSTIKLYVDGKHVRSCSYSTAISTNSEVLAIGNRSDVNSGWVGRIDEPKVYTSALSPDQIMLDMNAGSSLNVGSTATTEAATIIDGAGNGPVGEWKMDENTGTSIADSSGNGNTGTLSGGTWTVGKEGSAVNFDGNDDYISVGTSSTLNPSSAMTMEAWVYLTANQGSFASIIARDNEATNRAYAIELGTVGINRLRVWIGVAGSPRIVDSPTTLSLNTWYHVVGTYDGTAVRLYLNGKLEGSTAITGSISTNTDPTVIGAGSQMTSEEFTGRIDKVRIYNYARTQAQVAYNYNRGMPVVWAKLDECEGTSIYSSGPGLSTFAGTLTVGGVGTQNAAGSCRNSSSSAAWWNGKNGKYNASIRLDGSDDYIHMGTPSLGLVGDAAYTLSVWVKPTSTRSNGMFVSYGSAANNRVISIGSDGSGNVFSAHYNNNFSYSKALSLGNWQLLTITYDPSTSTEKLYVNGVYIESKTPADLDLVAGDPLYIGRAVWDGTYAHTTQIDDVRVYNYTLSANQVKQVYNEGSAVRFGPATGDP